MTQKKSELSFNLLTSVPPPLSFSTPVSRCVSLRDPEVVISVQAKERPVHSGAHCCLAWSAGNGIDSLREWDIQARSLALSVRACVWEGAGVCCHHATLPSLTTEATPPVLLHGNILLPLNQFWLFFIIWIKKAIEPNPQFSKNSVIISWKMYSLLKINIFINQVFKGNKYWVNK